MQFHGLLLIYRPRRVTHSRHLTYRVFTCQTEIGHRSGKVRWPKTDVVTTELRHQLIDESPAMMDCIDR